MIKPWAAWVTRRYCDSPNVLWTIYPKATARYKALVTKLAEGIQEGDQGRHVVSMHLDPSPASSSFMHAEPWLNFNSIQVWNQLRSVYPMTLADYNLTPAKPVTMLRRQRLSAGYDGQRYWGQEISEPEFGHL